MMSPANQTCQAATNCLRCRSTALAGVRLTSKPRAFSCRTALRLTVSGSVGGRTLRAGITRRLDAQSARPLCGLPLIPITINAMCESLERPMLVDLAATEAVSRDARSMVSTTSAASRIALLGSSPVDRLLATLFLGIHTPPWPVRFFTSRQEASAGWLRTIDLRGQPGQRPARLFGVPSEGFPCPRPCFGRHRTSRSGASSGAPCGIGHGYNSVPEAVMPLTARL